MADEKEYVSLEAFNELKEQISSLGDTLKSFQKLNDGLKKDIKALKTPAASTNTDKDSVSDDPNVRALAEVRKQNEILAARLDASDKLTKDINFTNSLRQTLLDNGIDAKHVEKALIYTKGAGMAKMDEEGNLVFRVEGEDGAVDFTNAKLGVKAWIKSGDADLYRSPKGGAGTGNKSSTTNNKSNNNSEPKGSSLEDLEVQAREAFLGGSF